MKWFNKQNRVIQFILLIVPIVNWIVEVYVRGTALLSKTSTINIIGCICAIFVPFFGWIDLLWVILFNKLCLTE